MILEEETSEAYGYYPSDLKPKSGKPIIAVCNDCGKVRVVFKHHYHPLCLSCANTGKKHPMFGKHHTEEAKTKLSAAFKGQKNPNFGKHLTEKHKAQISAVHKGKIITEKHKAQISAALKGANNPNWQGGISFEPYCVKFNKEFKEYIRLKFGYKCFLCSKMQADNRRKLAVHHVNYNKECGCDGDLTCQFVPLCNRCHSKTNFNRDYWQKFISDKLHSTIIGWSV